MIRREQRPGKESRMVALAAILCAVAGVMAVPAISAMQTELEDEESEQRLPSLAQGLGNDPAMREGAAFPEGAAADSMSANRYVRISLLLEATELNPGTTTTLAVAFDIDPEWHLYWRNPGDSGLPPSVTFEVPPGIEIDEPMWPVPERLLAPGEILDYVYKDHLTLLYPMRVSPDVAGSAATIGAEIEFLACRDVCIPGKQRVAASWPVHDRSVVSISPFPSDSSASIEAKSAKDKSSESTDGSPSTHDAGADRATNIDAATVDCPAPSGSAATIDPATKGSPTKIDPATKVERFAQTRARLPRPAPAGAVLSRWNGTDLELQVAGATRLTFFPYESEQWIYPVGLATTGSSDGDRLHLSWPEEVKGLASVQGVLEVRRGDRTQFFELNLAVPR